MGSMMKRQLAIFGGVLLSQALAPPVGVAGEDPAAMGELRVLTDRTESNVAPIFVAFTEATHIVVTPLYLDKGLLSRLESRPVEADLVITKDADLLELAKKCQVPTTLLLFSVPLEICVERNEKRERSVGRAIIERQYEAFEQAKGTIRQEGLDQVVELQDGDLEKVQVEVLFRPIVRTVQRPQRPGVGAPRRFERPAHPFHPRPNGPQDNVHAASAPPPAVSAPTAALPRPAVSSGSVLTPKMGNPQPGEAPALVAGVHPAPGVPATASPLKADIPTKTGTQSL